MDGSLSKPKESQRLVSKGRTRQKVLAAATQLFSGQGYDKTTIRDVAREAGMSTGAIFANFQGKHDLFEHVALPVVGATFERLRLRFENVDRNLDIARRLTAVFSDEYWETWPDRDLWRVIVAQDWVEPTDTYKLVRKEMQNIVNLIELHLSQAKERNELRRCDTSHLAKMVWESFLSGFRPSDWSESMVRASFELRMKLLLS